MVKSSHRLKNEDSHPIDNAGFFSWCLLSWLTYPLWRLRKTGPMLKDLWTTPYKDRCEVNHEEFMKLWNEEQRTKGKNASVKRAALKLIKSQLLCASTCIVLLTLLEFMSYAIIYTLLMVHISTPGSSLWHGWMLVGFLTVSELCRCIIYTAADIICYRMGIRMRSGVVFSAFAKVMSNPQCKKTSVGEIVNVCANDGDRIFMACAYSTNAFKGPIAFICGVVFLGIRTGWIGVFGCFLYFAIYPIQGLIAKQMGNFREKLIVYSDKRLKLTAELLTSIKLIKMYSWEKSFRKVLLEVRKLEMKLIFATSSLQSIMFIVVVSSPVIISTIVIQTAVATGQHISAVEGLTLFTVIESVGYVLNTTPIDLKLIAEAFKSLERFQNILQKKDFQPYVEQMLTQNENAIEILHASFGWSDETTSNLMSDFTERKTDEEKKSLLSKDGSLDNEKNINCLQNVNLKIKKGSVVGICGNVGSGKSSLLYAILGQIFLKSGHVKVQGTTGYCSQVAWIMNATVRDNILFGAHYDEEKYNEIVEACCLLPDLTTFNSGDLTEVGEHGINLSGGQKQRISLARAVYRDCDVYLLDDPLSAVDSHVGKSLFENVIMNLLKGKTVLLITHQLQYLASCDISIYMENGSIAEIGSHSELLEEKGKYYNLYTNLQTNSKNKHVEASVTPQAVLDGAFGTLKADFKSVADAIRVEEGTLMKKESHFQANTTLDSYVRYASTGGWCVFFVAVIATFIFAILTEFNVIWLTTHLPKVNVNTSASNSVNTSQSQPINPSPLYEKSFKLIYGLSLIVILIFGIFQSLNLSWFCMRAASRFHNLLFEKVLKGTMEFFDTTPTGRILNRFQTDQDLVDSQIPFRVLFILFICVFLVIKIGLVAVIFPYMLISLIIIFPIQIAFFVLVAVSVRQTQRLDNITRSPWISHIVTSCTGVSTIRSYKKTDDFIAQFEKLMDINSSPYFLVRCIVRWVVIRTDLFNVILTVASSIFVVASTNINPALRGIAMSFALTTFSIIKFVTNDMFLMDSYLVAVDRIGEYTDSIPEEKQVVKPRVGAIENKWPVGGKLEFKNVQMKYRENLPLALKSVSFSIDAKQRVGIVGRTGSGKSSLAVCLFRLVEVCGGKILIDDDDISTITLTKLRSVLNSIPQDPTLFHGSVRYNLDPFNLYSDEMIWDVLEKVHLKSKIENFSNNLEELLEGGGSLSMGEKQLICLARAILRKNKIVVLDEATASIDSETDHLLQQTLRSHFSDSTLLIIAHRLHTILDCDKVLVMDDGLAVEFGSPQELMEDKQSYFSKLIESAN